MKADPCWIVAITNARDLSFTQNRSGRPFSGSTPVCLKQAGVESYVACCS